jgi:hypothetical protein
MKSTEGIGPGFVAGAVDDAGTGDLERSHRITGWNLAATLVVSTAPWRERWVGSQAMQSRQTGSAKPWMESPSGSSSQGCARFRRRQSRPDLAPQLREGRRARQSRHYVESDLPSGTCLSSAVVHSRCSTVPGTGSPRVCWSCCHAVSGVTPLRIRRAAASREARPMPKQQCVTTWAPARSRSASSGEWAGPWADRGHRGRGRVSRRSARATTASPVQAAGRRARQRRSPLHGVMAVHAAACRRGRT